MRWGRALCMYTRLRHTFYFNFYWFDMLFIAFFFVVLTWCGSDLYALKSHNPYDDNIQLQDMSPGKCNVFSPLGKNYEYDDFYSERFITADTNKKIIYTIGLKKNETMPAGPFFPYLIGMDSSSGKMVVRLALPLDGSYLGLESFALEADSDSGQIFVIGKVWRKHSHDLLVIESKDNYTVSKTVEVFDDKNKITSSTFDYEGKILYVSYGSKIYGYDMTNPGEKGIWFNNEKNICTMDYDPVDKRVYGVGLNDNSDNNNGYMDQELYYFDTQKHDFGKVRTVGSGYQFALDGRSSIDVKDRLLFVFVGPNEPHVSVYYLFTLNLHDGSIKDQCLTDFGCCTAILSTPIGPAF